MKLNIQQFLGIGLILLAAQTASLGAQECASAASETVPITLEQFPSAETDHMMQVAIDTFDCLGK